MGDSSLAIIDTTRFSIDLPVFDEPMFAQWQLIKKLDMAANPK
jgi:hypothetical protein